MSTTRPKPWETGASTSGADATATSSVPVSGPSSSVPQTGTTDATSAAAATGVPPVPGRPTTLNSVAPTTSYTPGGYGGYSGMNSGYGSYGSGYGYGSGMGGYGSYSGYGGMSGMGGYGGMSGYGGIGGYGGYGGYNRMGMGGMGNPNNPLETSTAATFQLIESIVGAFGGFAQMLESTYMATHTSFYAMMSVAEQFGHLKQSLGSILGIFALLRWSKAFIAKISGKQPPSQLTPANFAKFQASGGASGASRPSFKPLLMFLAAVVGLPYLLGKLIRSMASQQQAEMGMNGEGPIDPSKLDFCRALYDFVPENPQVELELKKGDLVAVLSATDPSGNPSQWWRVRTRDGRSGYVPATYVEVIPRQAPLEAGPVPTAPDTASIKQIE